MWVRSFRATVWQEMQMPGYTRIHGFFGESSVQRVTSVKFLRLFDLFIYMILSFTFNQSHERSMNLYRDIDNNFVFALRYTYLSVAIAIIPLTLYRLFSERFLGRNVMPKFGPTKKGL